MGEVPEASLTNFEKLAIIREELDARLKDLKQLERQIDDIRRALERRKFLWSVCPEYYKGQPPPEGTKDLQSLQQHKARLEAVLELLRKAQADIEAVVAGQAPAAQQGHQPSAAPGAPPIRRHRLASFD